MSQQGAPNDLRPSAFKAVGLAGVGVSAPELRLDSQEIARAWGRVGARGQVARCAADEDTFTLAWAAAVDALEATRISPTMLGGMWWGTSKPPFDDGPSHAFLACALGVCPDAAGNLIAGSTHAGMDALVAAWDALASGHVAGPVLVVASDAPITGPGTIRETVAGAGAAAWVLERPSALGTDRGGSELCARLLTRCTKMAPVVDHYRGEGRRASGDVYDGRLFREEIYLPLVKAAGAGLGGCGAWSIADPDGKLGSLAARRLGGTLVSAPVAAELGDTGAGAAFIGASPALGERGRIGIISYGGGRASAVLVEVSAPVPGARGALERISGGRAASYTEALRASGQLEALSDPIPMGVAPTSAAFARGNTEMLGLEGARCRSCGTVSTPPSLHPTCSGCAGQDLEVERLMRHGIVETFVVNQTMPPPFEAPLPMVVVDLDGGGRVMVQGTTSCASSLAIGSRVELRLRRYAVERGVPVWGYKAVPATGDRNGTRCEAQDACAQGSNGVFASQGAKGPTGGEQER